MKDILQHINNVDGVIGSALFSPAGTVLAQAFPALIDAESLAKAASLTLECTHGLQMAQSLDLLDLRYAEGRVLVKAFPGAMLFLLCANSMNLQILSISLNLAVKKLEAKLAGETSAASATPGTEAAEADDGLLRMNISNLANKQASASFDSLGMIAISQATSQYILNFYKAPFKKLSLTNRSAGTSGTFPVMVMKDMDPQYDGSIVAGPSIEKKLKVRSGDKVEVNIG
jgi:predicted regulator of Ras-like GTPase activity (Roadblock/LC7/MglB family)